MSPAFHARPNRSLVDAICGLIGGSRECAFGSGLLAEPRRWDVYLICAATSVLAAVLLFARLGHYALWDDEAVTALTAKGVLLTGDTSALLDHNVVAYRDGAVLHQLKDRASPPLPTYLTAGAFLLFGKNALAARLPFALIGLLAAVTFLMAAVRYCKSRAELVVFCIALLGNVSFFLYARQCRYYSIALLLGIIITWLYIAWRRDGRQPALLGPSFALLFASHSLTALCLGASLAADFLIWRRKEHLLNIRSLALLLIPQALITAPIAMVWNPFRTAFGAYAATNTLEERLILWCWHWRDMNQCEFMSGGIIGAAFLVALIKRDSWLVRGLTFIFIFVTLLAVASPQLVEVTSVADVRYAAMLIPAFLAIAGRTIWRATHGRPVAAITLALIVFGSNLFNGGPLLWCGLRSTLIAYVGELAHPIKEPYTPTAAWLRANILPRESVWVVPEHCAYPLMFHAPDFIYAWQLSSNTGQFAGLAPIHFRGRTPPDYIVIFGPLRAEMAPLLQDWRLHGVRYDSVADLQTFWKDLYRPELFWRSFVTVVPSLNRFDGIYIFKKQSAPPSP